MGKLVVILLGEFVVRGSLLAGNKTGQTKFFSGLLSGLNPFTQGRVFELLLGGLHLLFGDNFAAFVHYKVLLGQTSLGFINRSAPNPSHRSILDSRFARLSHNPLRNTFGNFSGCSSTFGSFRGFGLSGGLSRHTANALFSRTGYLSGTSAGNSFGGASFDGHRIKKKIIRCGKLGMCDYGIDE